MPKSSGGKDEGNHAVLALQGGGQISKMGAMERANSLTGNMRGGHSAEIGQQANMPGRSRLPSQSKSPGCHID